MTNKQKENKEMYVCSYNVCVLGKGNYIMYKYVSCQCHKDYVFGIRSVSMHVECMFSLC